nr:hypothetical protein RSP673_18210 [Ralstonia solanacearum P673]
MLVPCTVPIMVGARAMIMRVIVLGWVHMAAFFH